MNENAAKIQNQALQSLKAGNLADGIRLLNQALVLDPHSAAIHNMMGGALLQSGHAEKAVDHFKKALTIEPENPKVLNNLGVLASEQGHLDEAEEYFQRVLKKFPDHAETLGNMGTLYNRREMPEKAEGFFRRAIRLNPSLINANSGLGYALLDKKMFPEAETVFRHCLKMDSRHIDSLMGLGGALKDQVKNEEAIECFREVTVLNPQHRESWLQMAAMMEFTNRIDEAVEAIQKARKAIPEWKLSVIEVKLARRKGNIEHTLKTLEPVAAELRDDRPENALMFFELSRLYELQGNPEKAFEYGMKGNRCQLQSLPARQTDKTAFPRELDLYKRCFTAEWVKSWTPPVPYNGTPEPVFLVGFPRSGTTLLEQILDAHPQIAVAGEFPALAGAIDFAQIQTMAPYPYLLSSLTPDQIETLRREFFSIHESCGVDTSRRIMVDKHPLNMTHAGMIHRLFPGAKIVLALRHPCDCAISCLFQQFVMNEAMIHFLDLGTTAAAYDKVFSLWERYQELLPLNVHVIKYEDLVENFRPCVENLLKFLDVPWDDAVMEYDRHAREKGAVTTPSYHQVTQKIYTSSKGRWTQYREQMEPALHILLPWAEKLGYEMPDNYELPDPDDLLKKGNDLKKKKLLNEALPFFRRAAAIDPQNQEAWRKLIATLEMTNRLDEAAKAAEKAREHNKDWALTVSEIKILRRQGKLAEALALSEPALKNIKTEKAEHYEFFSELGQIHDLRGDTKTAFAFFSRANHAQSLSPEAQSIDRSNYPAQIDSCLNLFTEKWVKGWTPPVPYTGTPEPVFLVGFPRSGTTLLGQILSCHPDIAVGDELPSIHHVIELVKTLGKYPDSLAALNPAQINGLREQYFDVFRQSGVLLNRPILIDKNPLSMADAGVISRLFPGAKFIMAQRHPCDSVLSCFMQAFVMNRAMVHFLDLKTATALYEKIFTLWERYKDVFSLNVHTARYEDLVSSARPTLSDLLEFLGLPWNDSVLEHDRKARKTQSVSTPSYGQVSEKLYTRAAGRWMRYREQMTPVLDALLPWAEKMGYAPDMPENPEPVPNPAQAAALLNAAQQNLEREEIEDAEKNLRRAVAIDPGNDMAWSLLAFLLEKTNRLEDAAAVIAQGRLHFPDHAGLHLIEAKILRRRGDIDGALKILLPYVPALPEKDPQSGEFFYELMQLYDGKNESEKAFSFLMKHKQCLVNDPDTLKFDKNTYLRRIDSCAQTFKKPWVDSWTKAPPYTGCPTPVFLVGFPRSGTTLLNQILSSHPDITGAEEEPVVNEIAAAIERLSPGNYPQNLATLSPTQIEDFRRHFFERHRHFGADMNRRFLVDKFPLNLVSAGLIERLFPQAKFILALRHPCDCVLSGVMQQFKPNEAMVHMNSLEDAARLYDRAFGLWRQYRTALNLNAHTIKYEDVVTGFRPAIAGLLDFIGAGWDDSVLKYDKFAQGRNFIKTPSYHQITQKIYTGAAGRWTRYREQMAPVLGVLEPWAAEHGYKAPTD